MSNMWMVLVIGLIPVVIGLVIVLFLVNKIKYKGNLRINKMIIVIYTGILITSGVVYELLPKESISEQLSVEELKQLQTENSVFEETLLKHEEGKMSRRFLKEQWSHVLSGNTLSLEYIGNDLYSTRVVVEWIDSDNQIIDGKVYRSHINVYGLEMEGRIPLHKVKWNGNQLIIHEPSEQQLTFEQFSNEFYLFQQPDEEEIRMVRGLTYIHLKVPKQIEIVDPLGLQMY